MPATYTHHTFTKDVYKVLDDEVKEKLKDHVDIFNLFGKSFDVLFFVKAKLGHFAHKHSSNLYFENIIKYIRENKLINNGEVLAYLYGSICHYVLDSTCHPYIYYKTGKYNMKDKKTYKYKGKHNYLEYMIDADLYYERNRKMITRASLAREIFPAVTFSNELSKTIDYAYKNTFCAIDIDKAILKGYRNYRFVMKHVMESRLGIKAFIYKLIDKTKLFKRWELTSTCYYIKKIDKSVLNLEHKKWYYPVSRQVSYHYSFYDLYDLSIEKARKLINLVDKALKSDDKEITKALKEIGNLNYCTGKNVDKSYKKLIYEY